MRYLFKNVYVVLQLILLIYQPIYLSIFPSFFLSIFLSIYLSFKFDKSWMRYLFKNVYVVLQEIMSIYQPINLSIFPSFFYLFFFQSIYLFNLIRVEWDICLRMCMLYCAEYWAKLTWIGVMKIHILGFVNQGWWRKGG